MTQGSMQARADPPPLGAVENPMTFHVAEEKFCTWILKSTRDRPL